MKRSISLFLMAGCASLAWTQPPASSAPSAQTAPAASTSAPKADPEAMAAKEPNKVVASINGKQLTAKQVADLLKMVPEDQRKSVPNLQGLVQQLYMVTDLAQKASAQKLDQQPVTKQRLEWSRNTVLAQAYVENETKNNGVPPADAKQYYDSHTSEFDRAKVSGIVILFNAPGTPASAGGVKRTEEEAKAKADDIEKKIKAGTDIATLARTESDDPQSAARGGELGQLSAATPNVPADMKEVLFNKLQPGQVSEPVKGPNAYYILKLDSRSKEAFEQARPAIEQQLRSDKDRATQQKVVDQYKLQVTDESFFGGTTSTAKVPSLANPTSHSTGTASVTKPQR